MENIMLGVKLMAYGLGGVFLSLIIFYIIIKVFVSMINNLAKKGSKE